MLSLSKDGFAPAPTKELHINNVELYILLPSYQESVRLPPTKGLLQTPHTNAYYPFPLLPALDAKSFP